MRKKGEKLRQIVAGNLRLFRQERGYTQDEIALALDMVRSTYTYYETGKTSPDIYTLYILSRLYRIDYGAFFMEGLESAPNRKVRTDEQLLERLKRNQEP